MLVDPSSGNAKYRFEGKINVETLRTFVTDFLSGKVNRYMKSEEIPEHNDEPVKVIVGK